MESAFVPSILDFTSKRVGLTKPLFCVLCVIRDSDNLRVQDLSFLFLK